MKIPKAKRLQSGNWRVLVSVNGERISITKPTKQEAEREAAAIKSGVKIAKQKTDLTVGDAIDMYIESKDAVLSPATIAGYKRIRKNAFPELMSTNLPNLTQEAVQRSVNRMAREKSPKSVANAHGLLSAAVGMYYPSLVLRTTLPQKQKKEIKIPDSSEIAIILSAAKGKSIELPILLAAWLGLRASEIRGIMWGAIDGNLLHIQTAIVQGEDGPVVKGTKTFSGTRTLRLPQYILDVIQRQPKTDEFVVHMSGQAMYKAFSRLCEKSGLPHYRFHDLRHYNASAMLAMGVPDKYAMRRMGHATNNMLKKVYQHTMADKEKAVDDVVDNFFDNILHTKMHTKNKK